MGPAIQSFRRADPNASIRSNLHQPGCRIGKTLVARNCGDRVFTKSVEPIPRSDPNAAFAILENSIYRITGEADDYAESVDPPLVRVQQTLTRANPQSAVAASEEVGGRELTGDPG